MTLSTRPDGGIDWEKCSSLSTVQMLMKLAAAHTRERCAAWHDTRALMIRARAKALERDDLDTSEFEERALSHEEYAAALRKIED